MQVWWRDINSPPNHQPRCQMIDTIPLRGMNAALISNEDCGEGCGVEYHIQHHNGLDFVDLSDNPQSGLLNSFKDNTTTTTNQKYCTGEITLFVVEILSSGFFS